MKYLAFLALLAAGSPVNAQFIDNFDRDTLLMDNTCINGWNDFTGDGNAVMSFSQSVEGYASACVDAVRDKRGIWWEFIKRRISGNIDLRRLSEPYHELRIEARVRVGDAPKRINLSLNTNRTTDFHSNLMEFDIPDTSGWHTVSMSQSHPSGNLSPAQFPIESG